jgi:hypothetical protein
VPYYLTGCYGGALLIVFGVDIKDLLVVLFSIFKEYGNSFMLDENLFREAWALPLLSVVMII